jgi:hypothetical protein
VAGPGPQAEGHVLTNLKLNDLSGLVSHASARRCAYFRVVKFTVCAGQRGVWNGFDSGRSIQRSQFGVSWTAAVFLLKSIFADGVRPTLPAKVVCAG